MERSKGVFRPSYFPALEECIRFEPKPRREDPALTRGTDWHKELAAVLSAKKRLDEIEEPEARAACRWAVGELRRRHVLVMHTELEIPVYDEFGTVITSGHADAEGSILASNELVIIDAKTGDRRDYSAQFAAYGLGRMDACRYRACVIMVLWLDLREVDEYDLEYSEAESRLWKLRARFKEREAEAPAINEYCDWCALRRKCPAWLAQGEAALELLPEMAPLIWKLEALKRDPQKLGAFMTAYKRLVKLVEDDHKLRNVIFDYLQAGARISGWTISRGKTAASVVNKEHFVRSVFNKLGVPRTARVIDISVPKLRDEWADAFPDEELPVEIEDGRTYHYAKVVTPKGRGQASLRRRERQAQEV
jgi:Protein of unknown function (DUF2800)